MSYERSVEGHVTKVMWVGWLSRAKGSLEVGNKYGYLPGKNNERQRPEVFLPGK